MVRIVAAVLLGGIAMLSPLTLDATALAAPARPRNVVIHQATDVFSDVMPCDHAGYEFTVNYRTAVEHFLAPGSDFGTFVETATFSAVPDDLSLPSYVGHFAAHGQVSDAGDGATQVTFTQSLEATGSDGSVIRSHDNTHAVFTEDGDLFSGFAKAFCR